MRLWEVKFSLDYYFDAIFRRPFLNLEILNLRYGIVMNNLVAMEKDLYGPKSINNRSLGLCAHKAWLKKYSCLKVDPWIAFLTMFSFSLSHNRRVKNSIV